MASLKGLRTWIRAPDALLESFFGCGLGRVTFSPPPFVSRKAVRRSRWFSPRRFEIHRVEPPVGSEEGGALVTVEGIGFGDSQKTSQVAMAIGGEGL